MTEPRKLTDAELGELTIAGILQDRALQRDISYTLGTDPFCVQDDDKHEYFFPAWEHGDPENYLRPEDILPESGWYHLNQSAENLERALAELIDEGATLPTVRANAFEEAFEEVTEKARRGEVVDTQDVMANLPRVGVPITTMEMLEYAIYCCDPRVTQVVGTLPSPFRKSLMRRPIKRRRMMPSRVGTTQGQELWNSLRQEWEPRD